jgi:hypothetical protein
MSDLALDTNHDLLIQGFDLVLLDGADAVRQQLLIKLKLWRGEWFLDTDFGTPYLQSILGKQLTLSGAVAAIRQSILEVDGVNGIDNFNYNYSAQQRTMSVNFTAQTSFGVIEVSA